MAEVATLPDDARKGAAADWLARLSAADLDASEAAVFDAWVSEPANGRAYDAALSVMLELEAAAPRIIEALDNRPAPRRLGASRAWIALGGLAAAAALVVALTPFSVFAPETQKFATAKGEHREVKLADGSTVELNGGSRLSVTLARNERRLSLPQGEALFDVAPDKARPFLIAAGERTVRVVGTRFDVRHLGSDLSVTVERGVVEVRPADGVKGRVWRLHPGERLDVVEGPVAPPPQLSAADPQAVESWRAGKLIYRNRPLGEVVADLNQQFARPIVLEDPALAQTRVSGVLILDSEEAVTRRLALLAPVKALPSPEGIVLRSDPAAKP
ncbi:FecR family protein [Phenylobacterium sp.]|jgi:transmembrane sensor|uniref:FecR family protein n=1 Tax=Phenylobacterium sp. TaxID=1871053 RepID=UPI002F3F6A71